MKTPQRILRGLGIVAFVLFAVMALILQIWIAPHVAFLPQAEISPYADLALRDLRLALQANGLSGLYKMVLLVIDPLFIVVFGLWVMLMHVARGSTAWSLLGVVLASGFMALDFAEDLMLAARLGLTDAGLPDPSSFATETSKIYGITLMKYAVFAVCLVSTVVVSRKVKA